MVDERLRAYLAIRLDDPEVPIPRLTFKDKHRLNRQTAFNRKMLESHTECGCFHCGRRFPTDLVSGWMVEEGEEDTGLCPYCGVDALIVGDGTHPLSTALLTMLYERWFKQERDERRYSATELPHFADWDDYLRRGMPFQWEMRGGRRMVAEVGVFSIGRWDGPQEYDENGYPIYVFGRLGDAEPGGVWGVRGPFDAEGSYTGFELVDADGAVIPFEPWGEQDRDTVAKLVKQHGDKLLGIFKDPDFARLQLFVEESRQIGRAGE